MHHHAFECDRNGWVLDAVELGSLLNDREKQCSTMADDHDHDHDHQGGVVTVSLEMISPILYKSVYVGEISIVASSTLVLTCLVWDVMCPTWGHLGGSS